MNESRGKEILQELQRINKLLALSVTRGLKQREKIELLSGTGFRLKEIANLIGTTPNIVSAEISNIKKFAQTKKHKTVKSSKEVKPSDQQTTS